VESKDVRHVLHEDVAGSKLANGSGHLAPQNGLGMVEPVPLAGGAGALAGEAAGDDVDSLAEQPRRVGRRR
jgi:flavin-dependent dehydrogenase